MLSSIFLREDAPLYLMVARHRMEPLSQDDVVGFVARRLAVAGLRVSKPAGLLFHELTGGIPFYVQKLGLLVVQTLGLTGKKKADAASVRRAFAQMLDELDSEFEIRWLSRFSPLQRQIVKALSELGEGSVTDIAIAMGVERTDISSSLRRLRDMMVLQSNGEGPYALVDTVFGAWLRRV